MLSSRDYYLDWARAEFGPEAAGPIAAILTRIDGLDRFDRGRASLTNMPVPADWVNGPGGIKPDTLTWEERRSDHWFVGEFAKQQNLVRGPAARERFDYWLSTLEYLQGTGKFACTAGELNRLIEKARKDSLAPRSTYREEFIRLRTRQMEEMEDLLRHLGRTISTNGELGTVANWQQHVMTSSVWIPGHEIERLTGAPLPESCWPSTRNLLEPRIILPTVRTSLRRGEDLRLRVILPGCDSGSARLQWRLLGATKSSAVRLTQIGRSVWEGKVPAGQIEGDLEYFVEATASGRTLRYPAGAPDRTQTVVVYEEATPP
jgi:hypothetical protein